VDAETFALNKAAQAREHLAQVGEEIHGRIAGKINDHKTAHLAGVLERFESDFAPHLAAILAHVVDNPNLPEPLRQLLRELTEPQHFTASLGIGIAVGAIVGPGIGAAIAPFIQVLANDVWAANATIPLSPALVAESVIKGVLPLADAENEAASSGINAGRFKTMVNTAGQAIGIHEAISLWRRELIDEAELTRVVHYSNVRSDFLPDILKLRTDPPSKSEAITGRLKSHLDDATARRLFAQAGGRPEDYDWELASSGRPISPLEMLHLWNRNKAAESDVDDAVAQSDINPHYLPFVKELRWYVPPVRSVMAMLRSTAIDDAKATELFQENGVRDADIPGYLAEAHHSRTQSVKELSQAQVLRLYGAKFMAAGEATTRLTELGYQQADITLLLGFADEAQHERYANAVVTRIHAKFTTYKLDETEARAALIADQIPAAAIDDYMKLWQIERDASIHVLSSAAIVGAARRQVITPLQTRARLLDIGVQPADIAIVVADGFPPTTGRAEILAMARAVLDGDTTWPPAGAPAPKTKDLTRTDLVKLWHAGELTTAELRADLIALGYSGEEADQIILLAGPQTAV
jgi:hypothetical protein